MHSLDISLFMLLFTVVSSQTVVLTAVCSFIAQ